MNTTTTMMRRLSLASSSSLLVVAALALPASARQDVGQGQATNTTRITGNASRCDLARVGTQFVACDELTGNGVPAPGWIATR